MRSTEDGNVLDVMPRSSRRLRSAGTMSSHLTRIVLDVD
jgi:hypothetical protein